MPTHRLQTGDVARARSALPGNPDAARSSPAASRRSRSRRWRDRRSTPNLQLPTPNGTPLARQGSWQRLGTIDLLKSIAPGSRALAIEEALDVPEVRKHSKATERQAVFDHTFERGKP